MIHELKTWPLYFREVKAGNKTFEVRKNDRGFKVGDQVLLKEYSPENYFEHGDKAEYTGQILHREISYILPGGDFGIEKGFVVLGLKAI